MNNDNLVVMVNQIGTFFAAMPDHPEAVKGVSDHLRRFWAPRMREQLMAHFRHGGNDLIPIVREALETQPIMATPTPFDAQYPGEAEDRHRLDGASES